MILIGIAGKKRSGKDTTAHMISASKRNFITHWYAEHLRDMAALTFQVPRHFFLRDDLKDAPLEKYGCTPRELLIRLAKVIRGEFGNDFFVNVVMDAVLKKPWRDHIIADVRYEIEADWVRKAGGMIIHVTRSGLPECDHVSEVGIAFKPGDVSLDNSDTITELSAKVRTLMGPLLSS